MDYLINNLPLELHLPTIGGGEVRNNELDSSNSYSYCGPGTRYSERIAAGYAGVNHLDRLCKVHDESYNRFSTRSGRLAADKALFNSAMALVTDSSHDISERLYSLLVASYFGSVSSDFAVGSRRSDSSLLVSYPSIRHLLDKLPPSRSYSSSKLLKTLLSTPSISKPVLSNSRKYNLSRNAFSSILLNKHRTSLLSSSAPSLSPSSISAFYERPFYPKKSRFSKLYGRFKKLFSKKKRTFNSS